MQGKLVALTKLSLSKDNQRIACLKVTITNHRSPRMNKKDHNKKIYITQGQSIPAAVSKYSFPLISHKLSFMKHSQSKFGNANSLHYQVNITVTYLVFHLWIYTFLNFT